MGGSQQRTTWLQPSEAVGCKWRRDGANVGTGARWGRTTGDQEGSGSLGQGAQLRQWPDDREEWRVHLGEGRDGPGEQGWRGAGHHVVTSGGGTLKNLEFTRPLGHKRNGKNLEQWWRTGSVCSRRSTGTV